jgi:hypothetical protein
MAKGAERTPEGRELTREELQRRLPFPLNQDRFLERFWVTWERVARFLPLHHPVRRLDRCGWYRRPGSRPRPVHLFSE